MTDDGTDGGAYGRREGDAAAGESNRAGTAPAVSLASGPVGSALLALAARGGWWAEEAVVQALASWKADDEAAYRDHFGSHEGGAHHYEEARLGYALGHIAGHNPAYWSKPYSEIDADLARGTDAAGLDHERLRAYLRAGYERARYRWGRFAD